eukprot:COSAG02_NODE_6346_length_3634_cov_4.485714_6_plen_63_part_00
MARMKLLVREAAHLAERAATVLVDQLLRGKAALVMRRSATASNTRPSRCIVKYPSAAGGTRI